MKRLTTLLAGLLLACASAAAFQPNVEIIEQFDDLRMVAFISPKDIADNPAWDTQSAPPLSLVKALEAVRAFMPGKLPVVEVELRRLPQSTASWHYLVKVRDEAMRSKHRIFVVLMSGKVIAGIIEPRSYK